MLDLRLLDLPLAIQLQRCEIVFYDYAGCFPQRAEFSSRAQASICAWENFFVDGGAELDALARPSRVRKGVSHIRRHNVGQTKNG
jgi:hypothetical protein